MRQVASPRVRLDAIAIGGSAGSIEALGAVLFGVGGNVENFPRFLIDLKAPC